MNDKKERLLKTPVEVHADKSSKIAIFAGKDTTLQKSKIRSPEKLLREFFSLHFYRAVLSTLSLPISSPEPVGVYPEHSTLEMSVVPGVEIEHYSGMRFNPTQRANDFKSIITLLGSTSKIKDQLGLVHGDYQARHIFYTPSTFMPYPEVVTSYSKEVNEIINKTRFRIYSGFRQLSIIDVENSFIGDFTRASRENRILMRQVEPWIKNIKSLRDSVDEHYEGGYYSPEASLPFTLTDYIDSAIQTSGITEVDFSFNPKRALRQ